MENKIINLAIRQIESKDRNEFFDNAPFFKEYINVFNKNKLFKESTIKNMESMNKNEVINISNMLIDTFKNTINSLLKFNVESKVGLIIFIGDEKMDGHGIIIDGSSYVFINLVTIMASINTYHINTLMLHEIIHATHYDFNKEFYPKNYKSIEDDYMKKLIAEGMATYMSMALSNISRDLIYWVGFLKTDEVKAWIDNCENMKLEIGKDLNESILNNKVNEDIYSKLFMVVSFENLTSYRTGYYYGSEIIKMIHNEKSIEEIFKLKFIDIKKYIYEYFKIE